LDKGEDEFILTIIISPRHLAHSMDKRTRANGNGERICTPCMTRKPGKKNNAKSDSLVNKPNDL